jgi:hypothetical protein
MVAVTSAYLYIVYCTDSDSGEKIAALVVSIPGVLAAIIVVGSFVYAVYSQLAKQGISCLVWVL